MLLKNVTFTALLFIAKLLRTLHWSIIFQMLARQVKATLKMQTAQSAHCTVHRQRIASEIFQIIK